VTVRAANTALIALRGVANLEPGQHVLVNGASGGVGTFAVRLAKAFGATVTAVCSTRNVELLQSLGADHVVDYTRDDFARSGNRYDVVLDLVGNRSLADLRRSLTPNGKFVLSGGGVSTGGSLFGPIGMMVRAKLLALVVRNRPLILEGTPSRQRLATLREMAEAGTITPAIDRTCPLAAADAIRYLESEHARQGDRHGVTAS
jgi:NADPH:quinone reductase-like Zn-dependent oxidoreductase